MNISSKVCSPKVTSTGGRMLLGLFSELSQCASTLIFELRGSLIGFTSSYCGCQLKSHLGTERSVSVLPSGQVTSNLNDLPRKCRCGMSVVRITSPSTFCEDHSM